MAREPENDLKSIMKTRIGFRWKTGSDWLCRKVLLIELSIKESWFIRVNYLCIAFVTFSTNTLCIEEVLELYKIGVEFLTETFILRSLEPKKGLHTNTLLYVSYCQCCGRCLDPRLARKLLDRFAFNEKQ